MKLTYFYLKTCPHCRRADEIIAQLMQEEPAFREVETEKIEETEHPEIAETYDYRYVPCFFLGKEKLMEGVPTEEKIRTAFARALGAKEEL